MKRAETLEGFLAQVNTLTVEDTKKEVNCSSCRDPYDARIQDLTGGYCLSCAREVHYGDISGSVGDVIDRNEDAANKKKEALDSMPEGQRVGRGKTSS